MSEQRNMASGDSSKGVQKPAKPTKNVSQEQIVSGFNDLRNQQKSLASKLSELEMERKEHDLVIETIKDVDPSRKCFRLVGGVLVERTVKEVLPALQTNYEQLGKVTEALQKQLEAGNQQITEYREKHNIRIRGEEEASSNTEQTKKPQAASGVLVAHDAP